MGIEASRAVPIGAQGLPFTLGDLAVRRDWGLIGRLVLGSGAAGREEWFRTDTNPTSCRVDWHARLPATLFMATAKCIAGGIEINCLYGQGHVQPQGLPLYENWEPYALLSRCARAQADWWGEYVQPLIQMHLDKQADWIAEYAGRRREGLAKLAAKMGESGPAV